GGGGGRGWRGGGGGGVGGGPGGTIGEWLRQRRGHERRRPRLLSACLEPAAAIKMRIVSFPLAKVFLLAPPGPARSASRPPDGPLLAPSAEGGPVCDSGNGPVSR